LRCFLRRHSQEPSSSISSRRLPPPRLDTPLRAGGFAPRCKAARRSFACTRFARGGSLALKFAQSVAAPSVGAGAFFLPFGGFVEGLLWVVPISGVVAL